MDVAVIVLSALVGALFAFFGNLWLDNIKTRRKKDNIRLLVKIDIKHNIVAINKLCSEIKKADTKWDDKEHVYLFTLVKLEVINWKKDTWQDKNHFYATAFKEDEINKIENFYSALEKITSIHSKTVELYKQETIYKNTPVSEMESTLDIAKNLVFSISTDTNWKNFNENIKLVLNEGTELVMMLE